VIGLFSPVYFLDPSFADIMGAAGAKSDHPWLRAILKGETEVFGRIGDENGISSLGVLRSHVFGLMDVERGMPRLSNSPVLTLQWRLRVSSFNSALLFSFFLLGKICMDLPAILDFILDIVFPVWKYPCMKDKVVGKKQERLVL
jgi:hypothetical protein